MTRTAKSIIFSIGVLVVVVLGLSLFYLYMRSNGDYYSHRNSTMECLIMGIKEFCIDKGYHDEFDELGYYKIDASDLRKYEKYLEEWKKIDYGHPWVDFSGKEIVFTDYLKTSSWNTHRDTKYGFEVAYPEGFEVIPWNNGEGVGFTEGAFTLTVLVSSKPWPTFSETYTVSETWQKDVKKAQETNTQGPGHISRRSPYKEDVIILDGIHAEKVFEQDLFGVDLTPWITVTFERKGFYYQLELLGDNSGTVSENERQMFDTFVDSMKFKD